MHLLVMGLGSSFLTPSISFLVQFNAWSLSFGEKNYGNTALNKEIAANEWQQKVKHAMKELNSR